MVTETDNEIIDKDISDILSLIGIVIIENGENKVIGRNHWVGQGIETIGGYLVGGASNGAASTIYIGSDTTTATTVSMTALVNPIGTAPGTAPNSFSSSYSTNIDSTVPGKATYSATWNTGTVSGTLGEVGLYVKGYGGLSGSSYATNPALASRLSAADGSFTAFTINTAAALTVTWIVSFVYT
jgi:hypothetical protein